MAPENPDEREQRILDAAADLFVHYGFDKTTVAEIARESGVAKGSVYLHFDSKEKLFKALIVRESVAHQRRWLAAIDADPGGGTIGGMFRNTLRTLHESPFLSAMFLQDGRVFGSYLRKPENFVRRQKSSRLLFVEQMQEAGAIRADVDAKALAHILNMLSYGLVGLGQIMDSAQFPPADTVFDTIADVLDRALTPADADGTEGKAVVRRLSEAAEARLRARADGERS